MQSVKRARRMVVYATVIAACSATVALVAQGPFVPAQYRDGALPQVPVQALGGGEVLLEVTVGRNGAVSGIRTLRDTPPFTDPMRQAVGGWRFMPAEEEIETGPGKPAAGRARIAVDSRVLVEARVGPRGDVLDAKVIRPAPPFDDSALAAARQWRFRPARLRGTPIEAPAYIVFAFRQPVTPAPRKGAQLGAAPPAPSDPFAFFHPSIVVSPGDRRHLDRGQPIALVVRGADREVGVFAAVQVSIDGDRLLSWVRHIAELKKSPYVLAIGRFSDPPRIDDLASLTLDDDDLSAIRRCRRGDCGLKLTGAEIDRLRVTAAEAGSNWKLALQDAFRYLVLERVQAYLTNGHAALERYEDKGAPLSIGPTFSALLAHSPFLARNLPRFAEHLDRYPDAPMPDVESFIYWSKERLDGKAIISATHVSILRSDDGLAPDALVAGKGIFATHYINASLGLTAIMRGTPGGPNYLAYVNRSDVDVVRGFLGGLVRVFMERRFRNEASTMLLGLRQRLESGDPGEDPD